MCCDICCNCCFWGIVVTNVCFLGVIGIFSWALTLPDLGETTRTLCIVFACICSAPVLGSIVYIIGQCVGDCRSPRWTWEICCDDLRANGLACCKKRPRVRPRLCPPSFNRMPDTTDDEGGSCIEMTTAAAAPPTLSNTESATSTPDASKESKMTRSTSSEQISIVECGFDDESV